MDLALNFKYSTMINPCILFNILNIDIKKIKSNDYLDFYELIRNDKNISSILREEEMVKYIKNNFMIKDS
jgi:hypothetical protein